jgi:hypothetical protein
MKIYASFALLGILASAGYAYAQNQQTAPGKIIATQGHAYPHCRMVLHRENASGTARWFRVPAVNGKDDINAVALSALISQRDTVIAWWLGSTTGCGSEPAIVWIEVR